MILLIMPEEWNSDCPNCGDKKIRNEDYDAYFCSQCDIWLENTCGDPDCGYCTERPETPSQVKKENN